MSYRQIKKELEDAIHAIETEAAQGYEGDDCAYCHAQGLEDAIRYLSNLEWLISDLASDEQYEEIKNRQISVSEDQLRLFNE